MARYRNLVVRVGTLAVAAAIALTFAACGGNSTSTPAPSSPSSDPAVTVIGDTPMTNALSAQVTISAVDAITSGGQVSLLTSPTVIELSQLGGVREPLSLNSITVGTYTGVSVTVSAARITYLDSTGAVQTASASISNGTASYTFPAALTAQNNTGVDLRLDFDLADSFQIDSNNNVTFTPDITGAMAAIKDGTSDDLHVRAAGAVTATTASSITLAMFDSGASITFNTNGSTVFNDNTQLSSIQTGSMVYIYGQIQTDGSYLAIEVDPVNLGAKFGAGSYNAAGAGRVYAVSTDGSGNLSSFQLVTYTNFAAGEIGHAVTVNVTGSTNYIYDHRAAKAGVTGFTSAQIFPGQTVAFAGASSDGGNTVTALGVRLAAQFVYGPLGGAITGTAPNLIFPISLAPLTIFAKLSEGTAVTVNTSSITRYGDALGALGLQSISNSQSLDVRGFIASSTGLFTSYALRVDQHQ